MKRIRSEIISKIVDIMINLDSNTIYKNNKIRFKLNQKINSNTFKIKRFKRGFDYTS